MDRLENFQLEENMLCHGRSIDEEHLRTNITEREMIEVYE